ncbi:hypothetical protein EJ110_NYTH04880 [Nymphaea thermarum]|nr:hypothetical protein EJ110_NYTH04880 [Nymphaea thermarum]
MIGQPRLQQRRNLSFLFDQLKSMVPVEGAEEVQELPEAQMTLPNPIQMTFTGGVVEVYPSRYCRKGFCLLLEQKRQLGKQITCSYTGGFQRIPGVFYTESTDIPRRSRCIAWRSAVEMVKSISQLALQVRYLDAHIRWNDLHRPEQVPQDAKGAQVEAFAFSRVVLCAKAVVNNETRLLVKCGSCQDWFHGEAVQLVESLINDVIGFKCCRCRKKCVPICPFADVQTKKRWKRNGKRGGCEEFLAAQELQEMPNVTLGDHMISVDGTEAEDDPLLFSLGKVEPVIDQSFSRVSIFDSSGQAYRSPQKLPVRRRHIQEENGYPDNYSLADAPMYREEKGITMESSQVEWPFSAASYCEDEEMMLGDNLVDCENSALDDMQYEPQTYFSLTELLASEGNEAENTTNMSMDATDNWHTYTSAFETNGVVDAEGCLQPGVSPDSSFLLAPCGICALSDPAPDVPCEICGFLVHSTCLPYAISEDGWKCGSCES